jgi:hypothetical protein
VRLVLATCVVLTGCGFEHGALDGEGGAAPDAPGLPGGPGTGGGGPTENRTCQYPDASNRLCLEFTDGVMSPVHDASAQKLDVAATGITGTMRNNDPAAKISSTGALTLPESSMFDIGGALTIEAWVNPSTWPSGTWNVIANEGQYKLVIDGYGHPGCIMGGTQVFTSGFYDVTPPNTWRHIACTYDGSSTVKLWLDGSTGNCAGGVDELSTDGSSGTTIAQGFKGEFDGVRIYAKDLGSEMCKHAGHTQCQQTCQTKPGG